MSNVSKMCDGCVLLVTFIEQTTNNERQHVPSFREEAKRDKEPIHLQTQEK
jgi:hypothetical protein